MTQWIMSWIGVSWRRVIPGRLCLMPPPLGAGPVDLLEFTSDLPIEALGADEALDVVVAAERRIAAAQAVQMRALARFAGCGPVGIRTM